MAILGVAVAFVSPVEFVSTARIMPEMGNNSGDMFRRLASVAAFSGLDLSDTEGMDAIRPDLYPNVLQSTPFILYLLGQPVTTDDGQTATLTKLLDETAVNWEWKNWFQTNQLPPVRTSGKLIRLTQKQQSLAEEISERVSAKLDTRSGVITITANMPDAYVAASVAQLAMDYLTKYVTSYRTEKARQDLQFYEQQLIRARQRYQSAQYNVFRYNDQHRHLVIQAATMDKQRMEAELTIAQTVYTELARQFEQARLKVQERTPVFKVLEPAQIPSKRVAPKRTVIVLVFALVGLSLGSIYLLAQGADLFSRWRMLLE
ncbi:GNVR domain-containing protein [Spirosoma sp. KUDC1026]|uniref:GNVR domain-containing protein n=1 Tax=Spirosoma sp. KUDC1026 TaxID=2745947 RepID=UPI0021028EBB|nr:GNVR domain-containing protein [Spirosoma sp. KUDC1026]